jgi:hypothetical protein
MKGNNIKVRPTILTVTAYMVFVMNLLLSLSHLVTWEVKATTLTNRVSVHLFLGPPLHRHIVHRAL